MTRNWDSLTHDWPTQLDRVVVTWYTLQRTTPVPRLPRPRGIGEELLYQTTAWEKERDPPTTLMKQRWSRLHVSYFVSFRSYETLLRYSGRKGKLIFLLIIIREKHFSRKTFFKILIPFLFLLEINIYKFSRIRNKEFPSFYSPNRTSSKLCILAGIQNNWIILINLTNLGSVIILPEQLHCEPTNESWWPSM